MNLCKGCVGPFCDYCKHYDFEKRWCSLHLEHKEPDEMCFYFHCRYAPESKDE